ncbi:MAG: DUF1194 domain-containing protein [Pseudomonadota bacterium]
MSLLAAYIIGYHRAMCAAVWNRWICLLAAMALSVTFLASGPRSALATPHCKLALVLALDVSGSVDQREYKLQTSGLAQAFRSEEIISAIRFPGNRSIAVTVMQWSGDPHQLQAIPWTLLGDDASIAAFADQIDRVERAFKPYSTAIGNALTFSAGLFQTNPYTCDRQVIDVSGDGPNNEGEDVEPARNRVVSAGITVNGLAILGPREFLASYYRESVVGGNGAFVISANTFKDYPEAIRKKLLREIQPPIVLLEEPSGTTKKTN